MEIFVCPVESFPRVSCFPAACQVVEQHTLEHNDLPFHTFYKLLPSEATKCFCSSVGGARLTLRSLLLLLDGKFCSSFSTLSIICFIIDIRVSEGSFITDAMGSPLYSIWVTRAAIGRANDSISRVATAASSNLVGRDCLTGHKRSVDYPVDLRSDSLLVDL